MTFVWIPAKMTMVGNLHMLLGMKYAFPHRICQGLEKYLEFYRIHHQGNFHDKSFDNDLAILELDRSLTLNEKVMPACLPTREYPEGSDVYISGWGQVRGKQPTSVIRKIKKCCKKVIMVLAWVPGIAQEEMF